MGGGSILAPNEGDAVAESQIKASFDFSQNPSPVSWPPTLIARHARYARYGFRASPRPFVFIHVKKLPRAGLESMAGMARIAQRITHR
jgi:hypothetical protein